MLKLLESICMIISTILGCIISYHLILTVIPSYLGLWWVSFWLAAGAGVFSFLSAYYKE